MTENSGLASAGRRSDAPIAVGLFAGFLALYLRTLCPTVYLGDSGDFCTAIATGGVPHPPGYPLFSLLGRMALALVPFGEPAFRIGCLVALAAAAAVTVLYFLSREIGCSRWAAATAAATFGASYTFWNQSTRVEVYSLHVLLAAVLMLAGLRYRRTGHLIWLAGGTLALSLGLAHHLTIVLLGPALLLLCGRRLWRDPRPRRRLGLLALLLPVGPACYLLLLLWARAEPLHAWGNTVDLPLLWNHASARVYRAWLFEFPSVAKILKRLALAGRLYLDSFPYLAALLPALGAFTLWRRDRRLAAALLMVILISTVYNTCYSIGDIAPYYLSAWMAAALLMAVALEAVRSCVYGPRQSARLASVLAMCFVGALLLRNWSACDLSRTTWVRDFARRALEDTAQGGVLLTHKVDDTFPIWYLQDVLKVRPDVTCLDRGSLRFTGIFYAWEPSLWYLHRLRRHGLPVAVEEARSRNGLKALADDSYLISLLEKQLHGRPVHLMFAVPERRSEEVLEFFKWVRRKYRPLPHGLLVKLYPIDQPVDIVDLLRENERLWATIQLPDLRHFRTDQEMDPNYLINRYAAMLVSYGTLNEIAGRYDRAASIYRQAVEWAPRYHPARSALALLKQRMQQHPTLASLDRR